VARRLAAHGNTQSRRGRIRDTSPSAGWNVVGSVYRVQHWAVELNFRAVFNGVT